MLSAGTGWRARNSASIAAVDLLFTDLDLKGDVHAGIELAKAAVKLHPQLRPRTASAVTANPIRCMCRRPDRADVILAARIGTDFSVASRQFDHLPIAQRDAPIHLRRDVEVVRCDDGGKTRGSHQLIERGEDVVRRVHV